MMQDAEYASLSTRQAEIAQLVVRGKSTREIALALTLSPRTVETHIAAIYNKYGVSSRPELIHCCLGIGRALKR
jgi:DNA-binding CsgD family transcriptional regulator